MSRLKWGTFLSFISAHGLLIKTSGNGSSHHLILSTVLTIFTLLGRDTMLMPNHRGTVMMPVLSDLAFAVAKEPVIRANHTIEQQAAMSTVDFSPQVVQMAAGPERVSWLSINLANPKVHLGVVQANNHVAGSGETLSSMADRTGARAGINGDFFDGMVDPIGLVEINGQIVQSPGYHAVLGVTAFGQITMGPESFSGSVTSGNVRHVLHSINHHGDTYNGQLVLFTPDLGVSLPGLSDTIVMLQPDAAVSSVYTVRTIQPHATMLPILSGQDALVGNGEASTWLVSNLHPGDKITISEQIVPDAHLVQAIGGGPVLIKDGALYNDPNPPAPAEANTRNPLTAIGVSKDGTHAFFVVFDGRLSGPTRSQGLTRAEVARYLLTHGAYQAMLFDCGGSSEMVARSPGEQRVSVSNAPSDGHERRIANGLFVYD